MCNLFLPNEVKKNTVYTFKNLQCVDKRQAITNISKLRTKFVKTRTEECKNRFNRQSILCIILVWKTSKYFLFEN